MFLETSSLSSRLVFGSSVPIGQSTTKRFRAIRIGALHIVGIVVGVGQVKHFEAGGVDLRIDWTLKYEGRDPVKWKLPLVFWDRPRWVWVLAGT